MDREAPAARGMMAARAEEGEMPAQVAKCSVYEVVVGAGKRYENPLWEVWAEVAFTSPSGVPHTVDAYWDGGTVWKARFAPDELGEWTWRSRVVEGEQASLHGAEGRFTCVPAEGDNPFCQHGSITLSADRRSLAHADGTPFFWLADTAWNGVIRATEEDWARYLRFRRRQGFTAIQFVTTPWRAAAVDNEGERAYEPWEHVQLNPAYFARLDAKVAAINAAGLVGVPVIHWSCLSTDPGQMLAEADAIRLARYMVARWGAYHVIWFLGGDGDYRGERAGFWQRIGRAVFGERHHRLVTMHPGGVMWVADEFRDEPWYNIVGYQSGHGTSRAELQWLTQGPPAQEWTKEPPRPIMNLEPNYETHLAYGSALRFTDREVRRAAYWSIFLGPTAGVTFGHNAIWPWRTTLGVPEGHEYVGAVGPWLEGLDSPGVRSMTLLRQFLGDRPWWRLRPAPGLLQAQPGTGDPARFVAAAVTEAGDWAVLYTPVGQPLELSPASMKGSVVPRWYDPRTGEWQDARPLPEALTVRLTPPGEGDWVLDLTAPPAA